MEAGPGEILAMVKHRPIIIAGLPLGLVPLRSGSRTNTSANVWPPPPILPSGAFMKLLRIQSRSALGRLGCFCTGSSPGLAISQ